MQIFLLYISQNSPPVCTYQQDTICSFGKFSFSRRYSFKKLCALLVPPTIVVYLTVNNNNQRLLEAKKNVKMNFCSCNRV